MSKVTEISKGTALARKIAKERLLEQSAEESRERFKTNVTRVSFQIKLSRPMMEMLCALSDDVRWDRDRYGSIFNPDNFIATPRALFERGLIRRKADVKAAFPGPFDELTEIGKAMVELMKVGGIFIEAEEARKKLSGRKGRN